MVKAAPLPFSARSAYPMSVSVPGVELPAAVMEVVIEAFEGNREPERREAQWRTGHERPADERCSSRRSLQRASVARGYPAPGLLEHAGKLPSLRILCGVRSGRPWCSRAWVE
jgi:hypothetical protein